MRNFPISGSSARLLGFLVLVVAGFSVLSGTFFSASNFTNILLQGAATAVAAAAMTYVILLADIDLSVGATMSLSTVVAVALGSSGSQFDTQTTIFVLPIAILVGILCGLINAFLINRLKLNALIVTLGTTSIFLGIALTITQAGTRVIDGTITELAAFRIGGVPSVILATLVVAIGAAYYLRFRPGGRAIYAVGGEPRSAAESGLSRAKSRYVAFGFLGGAAGLAGVMISGQVGSVQANLGSDFAFTVITAVVIGGTSLFGGRGTVFGSLLGAILLTTIDSGLNAIAASIYAYDAVRGGILILAMVSDSLTTKVSARKALTRVRVA